MEQFPWGKAQPCQHLRAAVTLPASAAHGKAQLQQFQHEELALGGLGQEWSSPATLSPFPDGFHLHSGIISHANCFLKL